MKTLRRKTRRRDSEIALLLNTEPWKVRRARYLAGVGRPEQIGKEGLPSIAAVAKNWANVERKAGSR